MPFKSLKQRKWMFSNKPELANKWAKKYGGKIEEDKKKRKNKKNKKK